jgi:cysteine-rich repeat protein
MRRGAIAVAGGLSLCAWACEQPGALGIDTDNFPDTSIMTGTESSGSDPTTSTNPTTGATTGDTTTSSDPTGDPEGSGETGSALCGNMEVDPGEDCDDGNEVQADGCNVDCTLSGSVIWEHVHASGWGTDYLYGVAVDDEGDAYVGGSERVSDATSVAWIRKYTRQGGLAWSRSIDGAAAGDDAILGVASNGTDIVVMGALDNGGSTGDDIVFARYDAGGNQAWQMTVSSAIVDGKGLPTPGADGGFAAAFGADGTPVVAGMVQTQSASRDVWVRLLTTAGDETWTMTYDGAASSNDQARGVAVDAAGNVIVAGYEQGAASRDVWVRKYDPAGAEQWTHQYDGAEMLDDQAEGVAVDDAGNVVVSGREGTSAANRWWVRKLDPDGGELWTQTDTGRTTEGAEAFGIAVTSSGDIAVAGCELAAGLWRAVVRKYDPDGNERWVAKFDGYTGTSAHLVGVADRADEGLYVVGQVDRGVDGADAWIMRIAP